VWDTGSLLPLLVLSLAEMSVTGLEPAGDHGDSGGLSDRGCLGLDGRGADSLPCRDDVGFGDGVGGQGDDDVGV
jgi:hypothetical protein